MREILFRGKRVDNGEWVEGYYSPCVIPIAGTIGHFINEGGYRAVEIDPETVGQYTGLTDKNGTKIFEGDILKVKSWWHTEYVYEDKPKKRETYWTVDHKIYGTEMGFFTFGIDRRWHRPLTRSRLYNSEAEVVGNIFDNSELLKREKPKNEKDGDGK